MPYVATFSVPYVHILKVGVNASTAAIAEERAHIAVCVGFDAKLRGNPVLLTDLYQEDGNSGWSGVPDELTRVEVLPLPDASLREAELALACARALVNAYTNGAANGGEIDWEDVDSAHELALEALARGASESVAE